MNQKHTKINDLTLIELGRILVDADRSHHGNADPTVLFAANDEVSDEVIRRIGRNRDDVKACLESVFARFVDSPTYDNSMEVRAMMETHHRVSVF